MINNYQNLEGYQLLNDRYKSVFDYLVDQFNRNKKGKLKKYVVKTKNKYLCEALGGMPKGTLKGILKRLEDSNLIVRPKISPQENEKPEYELEYPWITKERMILPHPSVIKNSKELEE